MWNLFFDPLLVGLQTTGGTVIGYADDLCILYAERHPMAALVKSQEALDFMQRWSVNNRIEFCPTKSENILFQWAKIKMKEAELPLLKLNSVTVTRSRSTKYLGLTVNDKLNWWPHINDKIKKGKVSSEKIQ